MGPRSSTAERYIVEEVASPAATERLFGVEKARATELGRWAEDALRAVEKTSGPKGARKPAKRPTAKRGGKKQKRTTAR
jgi:hypothetical protein